METGSMTASTWRAEPLSWGRGPRIFEVFLEPTCPYSVTAFSKLDQLLSEAGVDAITVKIRLHPQPWHLFSGLIVRCIIAASTLPEGKTAAKAVLKAVGENQALFEFEQHCRGPNLDATPADVIRRIALHSGVDVSEAFLISDLDREIKWHCRYARQNGIHVSPTFMIDGIVKPDMSSGDPVSSWLARLLDNR
jgi:hypothetical protein